MDSPPQAPHSPRTPVPGIRRRAQRGAETKPDYYCCDSGTDDIGPGPLDSDIFIRALEAGAQVIIGGRSSNAATFAATALYEGFPENHPYYLGKVLECASFCAEPYMARESVIGTITHEDVTVTAMHPDQRCTVASVARHAMYERSNAYYEHFAGGTLDMTGCRYEQVDAKSTRITGQIFKPVVGRVKVKLEGSGKIGERFIGIVGIRDPYTIRNIDRVIGWARSQVEERFSGKPYQLHYTIYGKNGVTGDLEPVREIRSHDQGVVVEGIAPTREMAEEVALIGSRQVFYARLPEVKGTAGTAAFIVDGDLPAPAVYRWTMNHVLPVDDPMELFALNEMTITDGDRHLRLPAVPAPAGDPGPHRRLTPDSP